MSHLTTFETNGSKVTENLNFRSRKTSDASDCLLFSVHISYGKGKYLNQTVFLQNLPRIYLYQSKGFHP